MEFTSYFSGSSGNLYSVRSGENKMLIEAGVPIKKIKEALNFELSGFDACLISHGHGDHSQAVKDISKAGIDCYMTIEAAEMIGFSGHRLKIIKPRQQFNVGVFMVMPFSVPHDVENVGFLIEDNQGDKLAYLTDCYYSPFTFTGLNIIAVECNYSEKTIDKTMDPARLKRLYSSHFSLENVLKFLAAADLTRCREIHLIHLSGQNGDPEYFQAEVEKTTGIPSYTEGVC